MKTVIFHNFVTALVFCLLFKIDAQTPFTPADALEVQSLMSVTVSPHGKYIAGILNKSASNRLNIDHFRFGDPTYIRPFSGQLMVYKTEDLSSMSVSKVPESISSPAWSRSGSKLAFYKIESGAYHLYLFDTDNNRIERVRIKSEKPIAGGRIQWVDDQFVILEFRETDWAGKAKKMFDDATMGPIIEYDSDQPFLKWDEIRNYGQLVSLSEVNVANGSVKELSGEGDYSGIEVDREGKFLTVVKNYHEKTSYNRRDGTKYELQRIDLGSSGATPFVMRKISFERINVTWSDDHDWFAWSDNGQINVQNVYSDSAAVITYDHDTLIAEDTAQVRFQTMAWSPDGNNVLARSEQGLWMVSKGGDAANLFHKFEGEEDLRPDLGFQDWSPDGRFIYFRYSAKDKWERGIVRYDLQSQSFQDLVTDENLYRGWEMSENGNLFIVGKSDGNLPEDLFLFDRDFKTFKQVTDLNPWIADKKLTKSELIQYRDADGRKMNGILYYPVDYEEGVKYPLVCEIYEQFFDNGYRSSANILANKGYFMFRPSVNLEEGYPGESWLKGVTAGINKLIEMGLVDDKKLGVHGTSYGGYATSLLITQTDRFAAAINISGKVNIISFLGDSPKIGTRNYAAAEVGQDRIGETLWEAPMKYFAHSAILYADRIKTPHLLLTGEGDWNVPGTNTRELYYAMRRLGKKVVWVNYMRAGHGAGNAGTEEDYFDHWRRILDWYETYFAKTDEKREGGRARP